MLLPYSFFFFFFNDTATTEIYTLSLHDALPILPQHRRHSGRWAGLAHAEGRRQDHGLQRAPAEDHRSEEHTSELQSLAYLVCRLLLEKKKNIIKHDHQEEVNECVIILTSNHNVR